MKRLSYWSLVVGTLVSVSCGKTSPNPSESSAQALSAVGDGLRADGKDKLTGFVVFKERAKLTGASGLRDWKARGEAVHEELQRHAEASQTGLREWLKRNKVDHKPFWIVNTVRVTASKAVLDAIARRPEVAAIMEDKIFPVPPLLPAADVPSVDGTEWGLSNIRAVEAWQEFGAYGDGIVVANIDTGVQYDHPALASQYRGRQADGTYNHNYNWYDPSSSCGSPSLVPCDNNNHGTHTMGTMVGDDGSPGTNRIGVAPHAKWIAAKGCESSSCTTSSLLAAGQWILAPTDLNGQNPRPDLRPNIVNNSWGGGGANTFYQQIVQSWVAAGIFPAFSNGNSGSSCGTSGSPGDYPESFSAGAYDVNNAIASFSSRGASGFGGIIKPNIAAPGVNVRSSVPGNSYASYNGTSMASPHLAGSVALLWSAAPALIGDIAATKTLLSQTAVDTADTTCGGTAANNNVWGEGRLDIHAAINQAPRGPTGTLGGTITAGPGGSPLAGATMTVTGASSRTTSSNTSGAYQMTLPVGTYTATVSLYGYQTATVNAVTITQGATTTQNFALVAAPSHSLSGHVRDDQGAALANVKVSIAGTPLAPATTAADGSYSFPMVPDGEYDVSVPSSGCLAGASSHVVISASTTLDFTVQPRQDSSGYSCRPGTYDYVAANTTLSLTGDDTSTSVALPFPFGFYGQSFNTAYISSNGVVNFLAANTTYTNTGIPSTAAPNAAIYALWDDLNVQSGTGTVRTELVGTAPHRKFVIEWRNVAFYSTSIIVGFEVVLSEGGQITLQYTTIGTDPRAQGNSATIGIENGVGTDGLQYAYNQAVLSSGQAITFLPPTSANTAPVVNAGVDQAITLPATASLAGTVTDDGLPNPPATVTSTWSVVSGTGSVTFANPAALSTTATFSTAGTYTLRLTASDSALTANDDIVVTVNPVSPGNQAPVVNAGVDQAITLPDTASLSGTVTDDGLPNPPATVTSTWSVVSGTGSVTFANPAALSTTATFSAAGTYTLRLTGSDSALTANDDIVVTVNPVSPVNQAPVVNAGADQTVTLPATASLSGTVTDDGLPNPPATVTTTWSMVSGTGSVTFANPAALSTTATFSAAGTYTLRLTASDSALTADDDIVVTVSTGNTPCAGLCSNPITFSISGSYSSGNLGTGAVCYQTTSAIHGGNCGNFVSPRTLSVNGTTMSCAYGNWSTVPATRNGGYCIQTTAGDYPWAYFTAW